MIKTRAFSILVLLFFAALSIVVSVAAEPLVLVNDYNADELFNGTGDYYDDTFYAIKYVPSRTFNLKRVEFMTGGATGRFEIFLIEDSYGWPETLYITEGIYLAYAFFDQEVAYSWQGADFSQPTQVNADTPYWVAFKPTPGAKPANADLSSTTAVDYKFITGLDYPYGWPKVVNWGYKWGVDDEVEYVGFAELPWMVKFYTTECGFDEGFGTQWCNPLAPGPEEWPYTTPYLPPFCGDVPFLAGFDSDGDGYNDAVAAKFTIYTMDFRTTTLKVSAHLWQGYDMASEETMDFVQKEYTLYREVQSLDGVQAVGPFFLGLRSIDTYLPDTWYNPVTHQDEPPYEGYYLVNLELRDQCNQIEDVWSEWIHLYPPNFHPTVIDVTTSDPDGLFSETFDAEADKGELVIGVSVISTTNIESYEITQTDGNIEIVGQLEDPTLPGNIILQVDPVSKTVTYEIVVTSSTVSFTETPFGIAFLSSTVTAIIVIVIAITFIVWKRKSTPP